MRVFIFIYIYSQKFIYFPHVSEFTTFGENGDIIFQENYTPVLRVLGYRIQSMILLDCVELPVEE